MSVSVFYNRFRAVAALSPLQYQKYIRLHEARRRMIADQVRAAEVGFAVGYESASQFSREYKRLFGAPPGRDTERAKASLGRANSPAAQGTMCARNDPHIAREDERMSKPAPPNGPSKFGQPSGPARGSNPTRLGATPPPAPKGGRK